VSPAVGLGFLTHPGHSHADTAAEVLAVDLEAEKEVILRAGRRRFIRTEKEHQN